MKELIPMNNHGMFCDAKDTARVDSRYVAQAFNKRHGDVLRAIENMLLPESGLTSEFGQRNFASSSYTNEQNKKQTCYALNRDGFTMLVMGFTGKKAMRFKEAYIRHFNEMERFIRTLVQARREFPLLTENIKLIHESPRPYHFSNECDMLNRIVFGQTAKQYRETHGIKKGESIRPHLTPEQIELLDALQKVDIGLLISVPNFEQRKRYLEWYVMKRLSS